MRKGLALAAFPKRNRQMSVKVTQALDERVRALAERRGWTVSLTIFLACRAGLPVVEREDYELPTG